MTSRVHVAASSQRSWSGEVLKFGILMRRQLRTVCCTHTHESKRLRDCDVVVQIGIQTLQIAKKLKRKLSTNKKHLKASICDLFTVECGLTIRSKKDSPVDSLERNSCSMPIGT